MSFRVPSLRTVGSNTDLFPYGITVTGTTTLDSSLTGVVKATAGVLAAASLVNADVSASAAIAYSKLNLATSILNADLSASAAIAYSKLNLTGAILNADLAGSIAYSKLILSGSIVNADISNSAAIAYSKLALTGAILNADLAGSIAYSKLSLTGAILNADLAGSIADGKLATSYIKADGTRAFSAASNQIVIQPGGSGNSVTLTMTNPASSTVLTVPDPGSGTANFLLSKGGAVVTGAWTFGGAVVVNNTFTVLGDGLTNGLAVSAGNIVTMATGAQFATSGGTPTTLNYYEEGTFACNFTAGAGVSGANTSKTVSFTRVGKMVTLNFPSCSNMTAGTTANNFATASGSIPSRLRPSSSANFGVLGQKNGTNQTAPFDLTIASDGTVQLYVDGGGSGNWTATQTNNGFYVTSLSYTIQ